MKQYACVAINDECSECSVCGRVELKRVMWLVTLDAEGNKDSDAFPVGTSCGATMLGYTQSKINTFAKNFNYKVWEAKDKLRRWKESELGYNEVLNQLNSLKLPFAERRVHPLRDKMEEISASAAKWVESQDIAINL